VGKYGLDSFGLGWAPVADPCVDSNEHSGSLNEGEFMGKLSDYYLVTYSASWS
jgi:hypothetical protein